MRDAPAPANEAETSGEPTACAYTEYRTGRAVDDVPATGDDAEGVVRAVWDALHGVEDPEMPISIVDLGLIYGIEVDEDTGEAIVEMTLTYTGCPARTMLVSNVESAVENVSSIETAEVRLVWSPEWTVEMVTDAGREDLREFGVSI